MRTLDELLAVADPAWPLVRHWLDEAGDAARVIAPDPARHGEVLAALQVSARSTLGALAAHTGGIVVDGWLRLLGGPAAGIDANLASWNTLTGAPPPMLCVAFDVLGGLFAIDGGGLGSDPGGVCYFAPDTLAWEPVGLGHTDVVAAMLTDAGVRERFFEAARWDGWRAEVAPLGFDQALHAHPPPYTALGKQPGVSRRAVPARELIALGFDVARQLGTPAAAPAWAG